MIIKNKKNLPQPLVEAVRNYLKDYDYESIENKISVTTLIDAPYRRYLYEKHRDEIEIEVSEQLHALKGSALHYILEKAGSGYINELRLESEFFVNGKSYIVSGKADLYDVVNKELWDYKDVKAWSLIFQPEGNIKHRQQLNILRTIWERNGLQVKKMSLLYFIKDWNQYEALKKRHEYPSSDIMKLDVKEISSDFIYERLKKHFIDPIEVCSKEERWRRDKWKVMNEKGTRAVNGGSDFKSQAEAEQFAYANQLPLERVKLFKGEDKRCTGYCELTKFCKYYEEHYATLDNKTD